MSALGFIPDLLILSITFILILIYRIPLAKFFMKLPLPNFLTYLIISLPFMLFEENINCLPSGCRLIPPTIPFLFAFVLVLGIIIKFAKIKSFWWPTICFSIWGVFVEYTMGASSGQLASLGLIQNLFMAFWVALSYAYLVVVPIEILLLHKKPYSKSKK
jgi:hypothetical protein